ncbi:hypothetical protein AMJ80_02785 [bacterium SM23_31]|nr:MAG: hypothetical protein AMJ80_02785 [bacterium SM23_31]
MSFYVRLLLVIFFLGIPVFSTLHAQTAQDYYKQGIELKNHNKIDEAIEAFKKSVEKDSKFAEAYYELALAYQLKKTPVALKRAEDAILAAKKHGNDDVKYLSALALIYEDRYMYIVASTTWERVLDIEPENIDAFAFFARMHTREVNNYKYRVDPYATNEHIEVVEAKHYFYDKYLVDYAIEHTGSMFTLKELEIGKKFELMPPIRWDDYITVDDSLARMYNEKILSLDATNRDALYRQGLLYYDRIKYQSAHDSDDLFDGYRPSTEYLDKFLQLFTELIENHPEDKDGHLFLGLAYHRMHEYEKAYEYFTTAKYLMSGEELAVFENTGYLKVGGLEETEIQTAGSDTSKFWYQRDPLYLTPYNERELEHYGRVAEANLRFSVPRENIEGWRTDQGKLFIKYGPPKNRVWYIATDVEKVYPEYYKYEPKGLFIDFIYDYATFRGEEGKTRVEIYYGVPVNKIRFEKEDEYYYGSLNTGVFFHDRNWNRVLADIRDKDVEYEAAGIDTSSDEIVVDQFTYQIEPDIYNLGIEIKDWYSDNVGTFRDTLFIEEYGYDSLQISDIKMAWNITITDPAAPVVRDNLKIEPNPRRVYLMNQPVYIYYEIYNLFLDAIPGNSNYTVETSLEHLEGDQPSITEFVRRLILNEKQDFGVTTKFTRQGSDRDETSFLRLDHNLTKPGPYQLTLKVTDNAAEKSVEKSVLLRLFEEK